MPYPFLLDGEGTLEFHLAEPTEDTAPAREAQFWGKGWRQPPKRGIHAVEQGKAALPAGKEDPYGYGMNPPLSREDLPAFEGVDVPHELHQGGLRRARDQGRHRPHPRRWLPCLLHFLLEFGPFLFPAERGVQGPRLPPLELWDRRNGGRGGVRSGRQHSTAGAAGHRRRGTASLLSGSGPHSSGELGPWEEEEEEERGGRGAQLKNPPSGAAGNGQRGQERVFPRCSAGAGDPLCPAPGWLLPDSLLMFER